MYDDGSQADETLQLAQTPVVCILCSWCSPGTSGRCTGVHRALLATIAGVDSARAAGPPYAFHKNLPYNYCLVFIISYYALNRLLLYRYRLNTYSILLFRFLIFTDTTRDDANKILLLLSNIYRDVRVRSAVLICPRLGTNDTEQYFRSPINYNWETDL